MPEPAEDETLLSELFWGVARRLRRIGHETLGPLHVSPSQSRALGELMRHGAMRPGVLAEHLHIAPRSATEVVDDLQERGLVERAPDPADRRRNIISLTAAGKRQLRRLDKRLAEAQDELMAPLSPGERQQLTELLSRLLDHHSGRPGPFSPRSD